MAGYYTSFNGDILKLNYVNIMWLIHQFTLYDIVQLSLNLVYECFSNDLSFECFLIA